MGPPPESFSGAQGLTKPQEQLTTGQGSQAYCLWELK